MSNESTNREEVKDSNFQATENNNQSNGTGQRNPSGPSERVKVDISELLLKLEVNRATFSALNPEQLLSIHSMTIRQFYAPYERALQEKKRLERMDFHRDKEFLSRNNVEQLVLADHKGYKINLEIARANYETDIAARVATWVEVSARIDADLSYLHDCKQQFLDEQRMQCYRELQRKKTQPETTKTI